MTEQKPDDLGSIECLPTARYRRRGNGARGRRSGRRGRCRRKVQGRRFKAAKKNPPS